MYFYVWSFEARPGSEPAFERAYGPQGAWVDLFRRGAGYLGTRVLRDLDRPGRYLTIDRWDSRRAFEEFRKAFGKEFEALDRECEGLTREERLVGQYEADGWD